MKVYLRSIDDLEPILDLFTPHGRTTTSIVHSAPVPPRPPPCPEVGEDLPDRAPAERGHDGLVSR